LKFENINNKRSNLEFCNTFRRIVESYIKDRWFRRNPRTRKDRKIV